jgi:acyl-CoA reductase-like NAD-dependent aldehyde dehydrogenase
VVRDDARGEAEMLYRLADVLQEHAEELARLESRDVGKPITTARGELPFVVDNLRFFAGPAASWRARLRASTCAGTLR